MEAVFSDLQKQGKNNVDNLVKWLKDAKIIDQSKEQEEKLRIFFADVPDKTNVAMDKFKEVLGKVTEEFKKNADVAAKQLAENGPKLLQAVRQAAEGATSVVKDLIPKGK